MELQVARMRGQDSLSTGFGKIHILLIPEVTWEISQCQRRPLAAARALLPATAEVRHRQEVHGGVRDARQRSERPHGRAGGREAAGAA